MLKKVLIVLIVIAVLATIGYFLYDRYTNRVADLNGSNPVFSDDRLLHELWNTHKLSLLEEGSGRTLDKSQNNLTTSEGQSYTMMRAVWMDDMETFDRSWQWTKDNLQRDDSLLAWKFGERADGTYGILTDEGGNNTATDADVDVAFALLMASGRWKEPKYKWDAIPMIEAIWEKEVVSINGTPVLAANDIERNNRESIIVNPSYFSPYAYRVFAKINPSNDWMSLVDSSYDIMRESQSSPLDAGSSVGLIPNWIRVDRATGNVIPAPEYTSEYGYDALRSPWRMALDYKWYGDDRARAVLAYLSHLGDAWINDGRIVATYAHNGTPTAEYEAPALYGALMPYFDIIHPDRAEDFYTRALIQYYNPDTQSWRGDGLSYYDDNWVWFGMAYHSERLPNLTELIDD